MGGGLVATGALAVVEHEKLIAVGKILAAGIEHPREAIEMVGLWLPPDKAYRNSRILSTSIKYSASETTQLNIIAFGDSNMVGNEGKDGGASPIELFALKARERFGLRSEHDNLAKRGVTTKKVIDDQILSKKARKIFERSDFSDVWINAGGNNLGSIIKTKDDFMEAEGIEKNPEALLKYGARITASLSQFEEDFSSLLGALNSQYGTRIHNLVIMSVPDISKAQGITSPEIDNEAPTFLLDSRSLQRLAYNIAVRINNSMFSAAERFQKENPGIRVIGIDTFPQSDFGKDQHLSSRAFAAIADEAVGRIEIAA